jgi:type I restriction enzyme S subunit
LNPAVTLKDSGVEWLGEVPKHWDIRKLKFAIIFQRGHDLSADNREDGDVPVVSSAGISSTHSTAIAKAPGIVTGRYGTIGKFVYVENDYWPINTTLYSVDTYSNNVRFLWYMMHNFVDIFLLNSKKSAVPGVDRNDIHPELTVVPPIEEQTQIVDHLDKETARIDRMVELNQQTIDKLKEYRTALITAAVTGKIDLRNWQQEANHANP